VPSERSLRAAAPSLRAGAAAGVTRARRRARVAKGAHEGVRAARDLSLSAGHAGRTNRVRAHALPAKLWHCQVFCTNARVRALATLRP
jgi:hypothetical protein